MSNSSDIEEWYDKYISITSKLYMMLQVAVKDAPSWAGEFPQLYRS